MPRKKTIPRILSRLAFGISAAIFLAQAALSGRASSNIAPGLLMGAPTALAFVLASSLLALLSIHGLTFRKSARFAIGCLSGLSLIGFAALLLGAHFGLCPELQAHLPNGSAPTLTLPLEKLPSVGTVIGFLALSLLGCLIALGTAEIKLMLYILGALQTTIGGIALLGHLTAVPALYYEIDRFSEPMSLFTSLLFILLGLGFVFLSVGSLKQLLISLTDTRGIYTAGFHFILGTLILAFYQTSYSKILIEDMARDDAAEQITALQAFRSLYADEVVGPFRRKLESGPITKEGLTLPLPIVLTQNYMKALQSSSQSHSRGRVYSPYPFDPKKPDVGLKDAFAKDAWAYFTKLPEAQEPFWRLEKIQDRQFVRVARPDRMGAVCVSCHNTHPQSPKRDWKIGDLRGIVELQRPLEGSVIKASAKIRGILWMTLLFTSFGIAGLLGFAIVERRARTANQLLLDQKAFIDANALLLETDLKGIIHYANRKYLETSKYAAPDLIGIKHFLFNALVDDDLAFAIQTNVSAGNTWRETLECRAKDQSTYWVQTTVTPKYDDKFRVVGCRCILMDITERIEASENQRLLQQQLYHQSKLASIGTLAAGVGHEINNPLAIVCGNLESISQTLTRTGTLTPKVEKHLEKCNIAIDRISKIVHGLRSYSRIDADTKEAFFLCAATEETVSLVRDFYGKSSIEVQMEVEESKSGPQFPLHEKFQILGNSGKIQQAIMNLLANAKDALMDDPRPHRTKQIRIRLSRQGSNALIEVHDNGPGIPVEVQDKIFDAFFTTKEVGKGTGLGLSMSLSIIKDHGGTLDLRSDENGTCFTIQLPLVAEPRSSEVAA
jgi:PAS domain S-box-containing protein